MTKPTAHDASNPLPEPPATGGIALPERYINTDWSAPGDDLPTGEGHWQRKGGWSIVVGELSHSCRDAYAGWKDSEIVTGMLSDLPKGGWQRAVPASELATLREQLEVSRKESADKSRLFQQVTDNVMRDCLVAIAGAVCTPEKGYSADGGFNQMLADIRLLRKQHDEYKAKLAAADKQLAEAQSRIRELEAQPRLVTAPPEVPLGFDPDDYPLY